MSPAFKRTVHIGDRDKLPIHVFINWDGKKLSLSGVEGALSNGDCRGSCGQIDVADINPRLAELWDRWHLNDMRPGCEHQRAWETTRKVEVVSYWQSDKFRSLQNAIAQGEALPPSDWPEIVRRVDAVCGVRSYYKLARNVFEVVAECLAEGWIEQHKTESKALGWVYPTEHPDGMLCKPCPVCGYKYGSAWLHEDVPADVVQELLNLKDHGKPCAWKNR